MITIYDFLKLNDFSDSEINHMFGLYHREKQKDPTGKRALRAYDLWRSDFEKNRRAKDIRDLNSDWEYYNRTHRRGFLTVKHNLMVMCFVEIPEDKQPLFTGVYKVLGKKNIEGKKHPLQGNTMENTEEYILEHDTRLEDFEGKLILGGWKSRNMKRRIGVSNETLYIKAILHYFVISACTSNGFF